MEPLTLYQREGAEKDKLKSAIILKSHSRCEHIVIIVIKSVFYVADYSKFINCAFSVIAEAHDFEI